MTDTQIKTTNSRSLRRTRSIFLGLLLAVVSVLGLAFASVAAAETNFETVANFGGQVGPPAEPEKFPEYTQLGGVSGLAINRTGAGGIAPGTFYTIGYSLEGTHVARFSSTGTFELLRFGVGSRCGPAVGSTCPTHPTGTSRAADVEVDETTGNVYVFTVETLPGEGTVKVYSPDLATLITEFAPPGYGETATESPNRVHGATLGQTIAVNEVGEVFIADLDSGTDFYHRLMVYKPSTPGVHTNYVYAGKTNDIAAGFGKDSNAPNAPVTDDAGNIYVTSVETVEMYERAEPDAPVCTFTKPGATISAMTVNPVNGEVFYYNNKPLDRTVHRLEPCNAEGKFVESKPSFVQAPGRESIWALAYNPTFACKQPPFTGSVCADERVPGVLYGGAAQGQIGNPQAPTALGYIFARAAALEPVVENESATGVTSTSATLRATINPKGAQTAYVFQYLSEAAYEANDPSERFAGANEVPSGGGPVGASQGGLPVAASITGLEPGHEYRYRVVATNPNGTSSGEARLFRTFPLEVTGLPDDRAYELVSPAAKNGGEVLPLSPQPASCGAGCNPGLAALRFPIQVSADGNSIAYQGQPFGFDEGITEFNEYLSRRSEGGWQTDGLAPPLAGENIYEVFGLDPTFSQGLLNFTNPQIKTGAPAGYTNIFAQPTGNRFSLIPLIRFEPEHRVPEGEGNDFAISYAGASTDLSRVFFAANDALTEETATAPEAEDGGPGKFNLYEWHNKKLSLVNVFPGNTATKAGMDFGSGTQITDAATHAADFLRAISADGTRVFWSNPTNGQVYVRIDGAETREVQDPGRYLSASISGSRVLLNDGCLYEVEAEECLDLTGGEGGFVGLVGQTEDLSRVYFIDKKALTGANAEGRAPNEGGGEENNLYSWDEGSLEFVVTLSPSDGGGGGDWDPSEVRRSAQASANGNWLAFMSHASLTGVDSNGACAFNPDTERYDVEAPCSEAFVYDAASGALSCASCNPTNTEPLGPTWMPVSQQARDYIKPTRFVTDEGRLFFNTMDSLSALDTNNGIADVYEYEPDGVGSCTRAGHCVNLISSGRGSGDSQFLAADPSGRNAFFTTRERLVRADGDAAIDLYDAREGGGIVAQGEAPPGECQAEACQPPVSAPSVSTLGSSTFEGSGNLKPAVKKPVCPKGKVRVKGKKRCQPKHKKKRAKHNKGGHK